MVAVWNSGWRLVTSLTDWYNYILSLAYFTLAFYSSMENPCLRGGLQKVKMAKKIPKEMIEHWDAQLKDVDKPRNWREMVFDPQVLAAIVKGKQKRSKEKLNLQHEILIGAFYKVFEKLPVRQKQALGLYFGLNRHKALTQEEIAEKMGVKQQAVSMFISRGQARLRKKIQKYLQKTLIPSK